MNYKTFDFLDLFIEAMEEDAEESLKNGAVENIEEIKSLKDNLDEMLRQYTKEIKILKGKKNKEKFFDSLQSLSAISEPDISASDFAMAYRKNNNIEESTDDLESDIKKLLLLKSIKDNSKKI